MLIVLVSRVRMLRSGELFVAASVENEHWDKLASKIVAGDRETALSPTSGDCKRSGNDVAGM